MNRVLAGRASAPGVSSSSECVRLSKWINEPYPPWAEILTAHDVARLARRHRWMLAALATVGRFPRKRRFRGRAVGWHQRDVESWLARHRSASTERRKAATSLRSAKRRTSPAIEAYIPMASAEPRGIALRIAGALASPTLDDPAAAHSSCPPPSHWQGQE